MTAKKIFNIVSGNPSGALNISMTISNFLKNNGYNVTDIFRKYNNTSLENITVIKDKFILDYILSLSKLIRAFQPDLIMVHGYSTHIWTKLALAHSKMDVKLIHIEHNTEKYTILRRYLTKYLDKYTAKYICVSQTVAEHLKKQYINENKVSVIYNGIDIKKFSEIPKKTHDIFTVGMVARFAKQKDHLTLIKAVEHLIKNHNESINLILMGTGKTKNKCEDYVKKHDLHKNIFFTTGKFTDLIPEIDTFVLSTYYEGQPLVICEAMASHLPVISTDIASTRELIKNGSNGLLFPLEDYKKLAHLLMQLKYNKLNVTDLVTNAYSAICQRFITSQMLNNYLILVKKIINK